MVYLQTRIERMRRIHISFVSYITLYVTSISTYRLTEADVSQYERIYGGMFEIFISTLNCLSVKHLLRIHHRLIMHHSVNFLNSIILFNMFLKTDNLLLRL